MQWIRQGGPQALDALRDLGEEPAPEDLPPPLGWELPLWRLYLQLAGQWRWGADRPVGLDLGVFIPRIEARGWDIDLALDLLRNIEHAFLIRDEEEPDE